MQLQELGAWVQSQEARIEDWLKTLVNLNTYTANTDGVDEGMDRMALMAEELGLQTQTIRARHRLVKAGNGQRKPRILLISHMDTVFPPEDDFQTYRREGEFAHGPGVGDIKGGLLIGLFAMKAVSMMQPDCDVQMVVSADEEIGSPTIREWYMGGHVGADFAIGLEPGFPQAPLAADAPLGVVYQRRGYGALDFTVIGKEAHSGVPHEGLSAIEGLAQRVIVMHAMNDPSRAVSVNVGMVNGGTAGNTLAGEAHGLVSFRYNTQADGEAIKARLEEIICKPHAYNPDLNLYDQGEFSVKIFTPPMERNERNQYLVDVVLEESQRLGHNVVPIARGGGSDANYISASGTPSICGMGAPCEGLHSDRERIHLPMTFGRVELLAATLNRLIEAGPR